MTDQETFVNGIEILDTSPATLSSGSLFTLGGIAIYDTSEATGFSHGGSFLTLGGVSIKKNTIIGGNVHIKSTTDSINSSTGALVVNGGGAFQNIKSNNASLENITTTNILSTGIINGNFISLLVGTIGNLVSNTITSSSLDSTHINTTNLTATNIMNTNFTTGTLSTDNINTTNLTATNIVNTNFTTGTLSTDNLNTINITATNIMNTNFTTGTLSTDNLNTINLTATNIMNTNFTTGTLSTDNINTTNLTSSNIVNTNLTTSNINTINLTSSNIVNTNLTSSNIVSTNITTTNLFNNFFTSGSIVSTNVFISNSTVGTLHVTNIVNANLTSSNIISTNVNTVNLTSSNIKSSNLDIIRLTLEHSSTPVAPDINKSIFYLDTLDALLKSKSSTDVITTYQPTNTKGDLLAHNGTTQVKLPIGSTAQLLSVDPISSVGFKWAASTVLANIFSWYISDEKPIGTNGGSFVKNGWRQRDLNTIKNISGSADVTISANTITMVAGQYVVSGRIPANSAGNNTSRLFNITDSTVDALGTNAEASSNSNSMSFLDTTLILTSTKTFRIEHISSSTQNNTGFGVAIGFQTEVYTTMTITKLT